MYGPPPHAPMIETTAGHNHHRHRQGTTHIDDEEGDDDVVECSNGDESIENMPSEIRYGPPNNSRSPLELAVIEASAEETDSHALYASDVDPPVAPAGGDGGANQLSLSFQGDVYVFDSVTPEKVQSVLLLLGGYEVPTGVPTPGMTPQNPRNEEAVEVRIADQIVPRTDKFKYLGSIIHKEGEVEDVTHRIKAGWLKWRAATRVLCDKKVLLN
ncbi:hypothetical protein OROGR_009697 [Orobanche gracilis]